MKNTLIRFLDSRWGTALFFTALFFIITPYEMALIPIIYSVKVIALYVFLAFFLVCLILIQDSAGSLFKKNLIFWGVVLWLLVVAISSIYNGKSMSPVRYDYFISAPAIVMLIAVYSKVNLKKLIFYLFLYYLIINTLNNASILFFHNKGMWYGDPPVRDVERAFFGHVNDCVNVTFPSLLAGMLYTRLYDKHWGMVNGINIVYSFIAGLVAKCDSQLVICIAAAICGIIWILNSKFPKVQKAFRWLTIWVFLIFDYLLFIVVILLGNSGWMEKIGIDPRIHGRRELWDEALVQIFDHPVLGQGYSSSIYVEEISKYFAHAHDIFLQYTYQTGLIGFAIIIALIICCAVMVSKIQSFQARLLFTLLLGSMLMVFTLEVYGFTYTALVLALCYYIPLGIRKRESSNPAQDLQVS